MSKFKLINLIDVIFITFSLFLILFAILQYFLKNLIYSSLISGIVTFSIMFLFKALKSRKEEKEKSKFTTEEIESFFINFSLLKQSEKVEILKSIYKNLKNVKSYSSYIEGEIDDKKTCIILTDSLTKTDKLELAKTLNKYVEKFNKLILISHQFEEKSKEILANFPNKEIELIDAIKLNKLIQKNNLKIDEKIKIKQTKISLKDIFKGFFAKNHAKSFFFGGFVFILTSFIVPFKTYYLIFGVLFLIFSIISRLNKFSKFTNNN